MKKFLVFALFCLLISPLISSIEIEMSSDYDKGETIIASVSGTFLEPLTNSNIYFYRKNVRTTFDYSMGRIGDTYYIYAQTDKTPGNYSIVITNPIYLEEGKVSRKNIFKNFTINENIADFSVSPGLIIASEDFYINLENFKEEIISVNINTKTILGDSSDSLSFFSGVNEIGSSFDLNPLLVKRINILTEDISKTTIKYLYFSSNNLRYEIPIYIIVKDLPPEETDEIPSTFECEIDGDCSGTMVCDNNKCIPPSSEIECITDLNCGEGEVCENFKCVLDETSSGCSGSSTQSCSIIYGIGTQSRTCSNGEWSSWGTCTVKSCNLGYKISGNSCVLTTCSGSSTQSCSIVNGEGIKSRTCSNGEWSSWGECIIQSCESGYQKSGSSCVLTTCSGYSTRSCSITNGEGLQSRTCSNGEWSSWGTCTLNSCNSGYKISGNSCVIISTSTGCTSNEDCKSGRICKNGDCVYPPSDNVSTGCTSNEDCKSGRICKNGDCVYPTSTTISGCTSNSDCKSPRICKNGECIYPPILTNTTNSSINETEVKKCFLGIGCSSDEVCVDKICIKKENPNETEIPNNQTNTTGTSSTKDYDIIIDKETGEGIAVKDGEIINGTVILKKCSQINGTICSDGEICNIEEVMAFDNYCCIGSCSKVEKKNTKLIGWLIIGIVFLIFILFLSRYKNTRRKQYSFSELAKRRY
ncbi:MAG: DUF7107 domain-containing protein [Nanobdellota archaeon]